MKTENIKNTIGAVIEFTWSTSRGADTYGYTICSLRDMSGKLLGRCSGGGYDLKGTSLGNWIEKQFQPELKTLTTGRVGVATYDTTSKTNYWPPSPAYSGVVAYVKNGNAFNVVKVSVDGACGFSSMERLLNALGMRIEFIRRTKKTELYRIVEFAPETAAV